MVISWYNFHCACAAKQYAFVASLLGVDIDELTGRSRGNRVFADVGYRDAEALLIAAVSSCSEEMMLLLLHSLGVFLSFFLTTCVPAIL